MTPRTLRSILAATVVGLATAALIPARAADTEKGRAELAAALKDAKATLEEGLKISEREGKPISAKFEVEDGKLQLSVYTLKGNDFSEVVADPQTGAITKAEKITDKEDLEAAAKQKDAMEKAKVTLLAATEQGGQGKCRLPRGQHPSGHGRWASCSFGDLASECDLQDRRGETGLTCPEPSDCE